jgi:hypothetical protein
VTPTRLPGRTPSEQIQLLLAHPDRTAERALQGGSKSSKWPSSINLGWACRECGLRPKKCLLECLPVPRPIRDLPRRDLLTFVFSSPMITGPERSGDAHP